MIRKDLCKTARCNAKGMTLIEVMLTVVIIGILASIAYPAYQNHSLQAHRNLAKADMVKLQLLLEQNYGTGYSWGSLLSGGSCTVCESSNERYLFSITSSATAAYTIVATAQNTKGQTNDSCLPSNHQMSLSSDGEALPSECW
ncbi:type IV pilin protein [Vibrio paucivorans]